MGFCGSADTYTGDSSGIDKCYRSLVYLAIPTAICLLGFCFAHLQESKLQKNRKTFFKCQKVFSLLQVIDWLRLVTFILTGFAPLIFYVIEQNNWQPGHGLDGYMLVESLIYGILTWIVMGCSWLIHEIRRGSEEWKWLRLFTFFSFIGECLVLWSNIENLEKEYGVAKKHKEYVTVKAITLVILNFLSCFFMVCFSRNWRKIRFQLRNKERQYFDENNESDLIYERFIEEEEEGNLEEENMPVLSSEIEGHKPTISARTPEQYAGLLSRLSFFWMENIMAKGARRPIEDEDFYRTLREDDPKLLFNKFWSAFTNVQDEIVKKKTAKVDFSNSDDIDYTRLEDNLDSADDNGDNSEKNEKIEKERPQGSVKVILKAFHRSGILNDFYIAAIFKIVYDTLMFIGPQILKKLINALEKDKSQGYMWVGIMFLTSLTQTFVLHQYFHRVFRTGMNMRSTLITAIFKKSLRLTPSAREEYKTGELINLLSNDCTRLNNVFPYLHTTWSSPYQVFLAIFFLWKELHYAVIISVLFILMCMTPLTSYVVKKQTGIQKQLMKVKDVRIRAAGEAVTSMKVIKLYGWERNFRERIDNCREDELKLLRKYVLVRALSTTLWNATPILVTLTTFAAYVILGGNLTASKTFTSLSLLNLLRFPLAILPNILNAASEAMVSLRRVSTFLETKELDLKLLQNIQKNTNKPENSVVFVKEGFFYWDDNLKKSALKNINLDIKEGTLNVVTGEVGSGKTALLNMLCGELQFSFNNPITMQPQELSISGSISLATQEPWIQNLSLRDNILFGLPFEKQWYKKVINACGLTSDLEQLPEGDSTEIGERGINVSGGQKARISLARAVYSRSDILLLEQCFEAVDEHVSAHLSKKCFNGILKEPNPLTGKKRTVIIVTHALKYMEKIADHFIVMKNGSICEQGKFKDIIKTKDGELKRLYQTYKEESLRKQSITSEDISSDFESSEKEKKLRAFSTSQKSNASIIKKDNDQGKNLTGQEHMEIGKVDWQVYKDYINALGGLKVVGMIILGLACRTGSDVLTSAWLAYWSNENDKHEKKENVTAHIGHHMFNHDELFAKDGSNGLLSNLYGLNTLSNNTDLFTTISTSSSSDEKSAGFYLGIYGVLSFFSLAVVGIVSVYMALTYLHASKTMHERMFSSIMRAPMAFFDTTPLGRILNRITKDVDTIDDTLPQSMYSFLSQCFSVTGTLGTIIAVIPIFSILVLPLGYLYLRIQNFYISSSRQFKRWDSVLRSPIFSLYSEVLDGIDTIRSYSASARFSTLNQEQLEKQLRAQYLNISTNRWLAVRLETIGNLIVVFTSLFFLLFTGNRAVSFGALAISNALNITQSLNWTVRMSSEVETNIVSVERVSEYINIDSEAPNDAPDSSLEPVGEWPEKGEIVFENVSARYRPGLDLVLKGLNFRVSAGEKVGVVGRTGSGKSTILLTLLRIIECAGGRIVIDGFDIHNFGLERLRCNIAIIPQDPVLFSATLRENIDPLGQFSDLQIWDALKFSHLQDFAESLVTDSGNALDYVIQEGGSNFSFGQRQLLCIARALLRRCKIVLLDEATSGIDQHMDELIQKTIRSEFKNGTVLTIAHRLNTVMDSDKILVMDDGVAAEFDSPEKLKSNPNSLFTLLVNQMDKANNKK